MAKQQFREGEVAVEGLAEFNRAMRKVDAQLPSIIKAEFKEVATATAGVIAGKIPKKTGKMAASVKPRSSANYAAIAAYGAKVPYGRFVDFGGGLPGVRGVRPGGSAGASRRFWIAEGRYIFPTLYDLREESMEAAEKVLDTVLKEVT